MIAPHEMKIAVEARLETTGGRPEMYMRAMIPPVWMTIAMIIANSAPRRSGVCQKSHDKHVITNAVRYSAMHWVKGSKRLNSASNLAFFAGGSFSLRVCV